MTKTKRWLIGFTAGVALVAVLYGITFIVKSSKGVAWLSTLNAPTIKTKVSNLEMAGYDGRLYEFQMKDGRQCIAVATSEGVGVTCNRKGK